MASTLGVIVLLALQLVTSPPLSFSVAKSLIWIVTETRDGDSTKPPKRIRITANVPDDTELCVAPSANEPDACVTLGWWREGLKR